MKKGPKPKKKNQTNQKTKKPGSSRIRATSIIYLRDLVFSWFSSLLFISGFSGLGPFFTRTLAIISFSWFSGHPSVLALVFPRNLSVAVPLDPVPEWLTVPSVSLRISSHLCPSVFGTMSISRCKKSTGMTIC